MNDANRGFVSYEPPLDRTFGEVWRRHRSLRSLALVGLCAATLVLFAAGCRMAHIQPESATEDPPNHVQPEEQTQPEEQNQPKSNPRDGQAVLAMADVAASEGDREMVFTVRLNRASSAAVVVEYATEDGTADSGSDYGRAGGSLTFPAHATGVRTMTVTIHEDAVDEAEETFRVRASGALGATQSLSAVATGTIIDNDARSVTFRPAELNVVEGRTARYTVVLGSRPTAPVIVTPVAPAGLSVDPPELRFAPSSWATAQTVTVAAAQDDDAAADPATELAHVVRGGGYGGSPARSVRVTIVEDDVPTLSVDAVAAQERAGKIAFEVRLSLAGDQRVTVDYTTGAAGDSAEEGADYAGASGELVFPAGSTASQEVVVAVHDDALDEEDERFTLTLRNPENAVLAGGADTTTATAAIEDDDELPELTITGMSGVESAGNVVLSVRLDRASGRTVTVRYATADVTAGAADYTAQSGTLTFEPGDLTKHIVVAISDDAANEEDESFAVALTAPVHAVLSSSGRSATGTIVDDDNLPLTLAALTVTGAGTVYPEFASDVHHYAAICEDSTTVQVAARAHRSGATLTLRRRNSDDDQVSQGNLSAQLSVDDDADIAIELSDTDGMVTYVVHCVPASLPRFKVLKKTQRATPGLLFVTPQVYTSRYNFPYRYLAIVDYNGVPRFTSGTALMNFNFRPYADGPLIDGKRVRYSHGWGVLLDENFSKIREVSTPGGDPHDFLVSRGGTFFFVIYKAATRDYLNFGDVRVKDSVIREVDAAGTTVFEWNSWDYMKLSDCSLTRSGGEYAHLNSVQLVDGDIVASFKGCNQVLRIDRSSGTGAIEWQLGGTSPPRNSATQFLRIVDDDDVETNDEICGQHHATVTNSGSVLLFDNGDGCLGTRKSLPQFTRVVEFDISSGTQASRLREYQLPEDQGYADFAGGVVELDNGNWVITWGRTGAATAAADQLISISEVDPDANPPVSVFELNMSRSPRFVTSYRVYHEAEEDVRIPLNLP